MLHKNSFRTTNNGPGDIWLSIIVVVLVLSLTTPNRDSINPGRYIYTSGKCFMVVPALVKLVFNANKNFKLLSFIDSDW